MSWSAEANADGHTPFDASNSETDVEVNRDFAGEEKRKDDDFQKRLTLTFKNVTVNVTAPGEALGDTLLSWVNPSQLLDVFRKEEHTKRVWTWHLCSGLITVETDMVPGYSARG